MTPYQSALPRRASRRARAARRWRLVSALLLPCLVAAALPRRAPVTLFIAGDSTAAPKLAEKRPETGWGEMLPQWFDTAAVRVDDRARNGRSTRSFRSEGLWDAVLADLRAGDYVFIQFGHNDESPDKGDRYAPPAEFRGNLARMVAEVRARGGLPVLLTPVVRRKFGPDGALLDTHGEYPGLVRAVARAEGVPLIDLERATARVVASYGPAGSRSLYLQLRPGEHPNYPAGVADDTHFAPVGAAIVAELTVEGIRASVPGLARLVRPAPRLP